MSDIISGTARGAGRAVTLAIAGLLVMASLGLRLSELDRFMTPDEIKWTCRSVSFYRALASRDLAGTLRTGHPGVITMWLGVPWMGVDLDQDWLVACANPSLADLIKTNPRGTAARLAELTFAARRGVVALTSLAVGFAFLLLTRLCGRRSAFVASLFVLLDPFLMAHSRFLHLDAVVTSLLFPSLLCLAIGLREGKRWFLAGAGALGALAALNKSPAMFVAPFALAVMGVAWLLRRRPFGELLRDALAYGLAFALTYMALWPSLWVRPLQTLQTVFGTALFYASNPHTNSNYFLGAPRPDPGIAFYPVALLFRLTPWVACALPLVALPFIRRDERRDLLGILASFALLYGAFMTVGQKKFDRYLLPVLPAVQTLAAIALLSAVRWLLGRTRLRRVEPAATLGVSALALVLAQVMVLPHAPYYLTYYSSLLGGADAAVQTILVGWGEGLDEAARYLNALPDAADRTVVVR
ncbi:MAG: hypothetical protein FJZ90_18475, partial [Chloroflexi bacterium]|nr:hypothetical protein [Chloroflexota bacterium]